MPEPVNMLTGTKTHEVSVVDRGANRRVFALTKAEGKPMKVLEAVLATQVENEEQLESVAKEAGLSEKAQEAALGLLRLMKGFSDELSPEAIASIAKAAGLELPVAEVVETEETKEVEKALDLPEEAQLVLKAAQDEISQLKEQNKAVLKDLHALNESKEAREYLEKAKDFDKVAPAAELGPVLKDLNAASPELRERVETILKSAQERIDTSKLFEQVGTEKAATPNPWEKIQKAAAKLEEQGVSYDVALERAMHENPELVRESQESVGA